MYESDSDKPSIVGPYPTQIKRIAIAAALVLAACAGPREPAGDAGQAEAGSLIAQAREAAELREYPRALDLFSQAMAQSRDPEAARQAAQLASALEAWDEAEQAAMRWLELEPDSQSAAQLAVIARLRQGRVEPAIEVLVDRLMPRDGDARSREDAWQTATALLAAADSSETARAAFERLLAETGPHAPGFEAYAASRLAWQTGQPGEAFELAERAYRAEPGFERALWAARMARSQAGDERVLQYLRAARQIRPDDREAAMAEAEILRDLGRLEQALAVLEGLPDDPEVLYTTGALQHELDRLAAAGATWQRLASLDAPEDSSRHAWLTGLLAEVLGFDQAAVEWYAKVEGEAAGRARLRRAIALAGTGNLDAARDALSRLRHASDGELVERSWLVEGQILAESVGQQAAMDLYSEALTQLPGSTDLLYARAMSAVQLDELSLAEQDLRTIIQREPDNAVALNALGYTLSDRTDRHREALRMIERALELEPENPAILDSMGWVLYKLGRPEEALDYIRRAVEADPHPEIVAHLIEVLWAVDRRAEAREWIARTEGEYSGEKVFDETLARLGIE